MSNPGSQILWSPIKMRRPLGRLIFLSRALEDLLRPRRPAGHQCPSPRRRVKRATMRSETPEERRGESGAYPPLEGISP